MSEDDSKALKIENKSPDEAVVALMKYWLEDAISGDLRGVFIVGICGGTIKRAIAGDCNYSEFVYACEVTKHDLITRAMSLDTEVIRDKE